LFVALSSYNTKAWCESLIPPLLQQIDKELEDEMEELNHIAETGTFELIDVL